MSEAQIKCAGCAATERLRKDFSCNDYSIMRCDSCNSLMTFPLPTPQILSEHYVQYNKNYTAGMGEARYQREMPKRWNARLNVLQRFGAHGRLLDLGGANGMFSKMASSVGFDVSVADFIAEPIDLEFTVAQPANLNAVRGTPYADATFDVVTLWSCIEHLLAPQNGLDEMYRVCVPGGLVAIDTPLVGDLCERFFAARSHWITPPEHLHLFSADGLQQAVVRAGFKVLYHSPFFERSISRWFARRGRNIAEATAGALQRVVSPKNWQRRRSSGTTAAGDIQFLVATKPR